MPNPFKNKTSVFPEITQAVGDAYDENLANGEVAEDSTAEQDLSELSKQALDPRNFMDKKILEIADQEIAATFHDAFVNTQKLFEWFSETVPSPTEFSRAGVDFGYLAKEYKKMTDNKLEPSLVICPALPLKGTLNNCSVGLSWRGIYSYLTADSENLIPDNPLGTEDGEPGLCIGDISDVNTDILFNNELEVVMHRPDIHLLHNGDHQNRFWTVALIPGTQMPQHMGENRKKLTNDQNPAQSRLATFSQYLCFQAIRIQNGLTPLDDADNGIKHWTDLGGIYVNTDNKKTVTVGANWRPECGQIVIARGDLSNNGDDSVGFRIPVWG